MVAKIKKKLFKPSPVLHTLKASSSCGGGGGDKEEGNSCAKVRNERFFTRHVSHIVHVVRPDVPGAGQHVGFAQQRPETAYVCGRHGRVSSAFVAHAVNDLCGGGGGAML